jgi:hypothetical protein
MVALEGESELRIGVGTDGETQGGVDWLPHPLRRIALREIKKRSRRDIMASSRGP